MPKILLAAAVLTALVAINLVPLGHADTPLSFQATATYQGKDVHWWAKRAQQARKDANARAVTIRRLRRTLSHDPSVEESIRLATTLFPRFSECRAWAIIKHESWMVRDPLHAKNPRSSATGLYQFLVSTFNSTPFADFSMYSPYAQSLAAGWMHQHGRGGEWAIRSC